MFGRTMTETPCGGVRETEGERLPISGVDDTGENMPIRMIGRGGAEIGVVSMQASLEWKPVY